MDVFRFNHATLQFELQTPQGCIALATFIVFFHPSVWVWRCQRCLSVLLSLPQWHWCPLVSWLTVWGWPWGRGSGQDCPCAAGRFPVWQRTCRAGLSSGTGLQLVSLTPSTVPKAVLSRRLPCCQITGGLCLDDTACVGPPLRGTSPLTNPWLFFPVARAS